MKVKWSFVCSITLVLIRVNNGKEKGKILFELSSVYIELPIFNTHGTHYKPMDFAILLIWLWGALRSLKCKKFEIALFFSDF